MERSFQDLDLTQIKVGAESRFPPEDGEANPSENGNGATPSASTETEATDSAPMAAASPSPVSAPMAAASPTPVRAPSAPPPAAQTSDDDDDDVAIDPHHLQEGILKVSSHSRHSAVAGAIAGVLRHDSKAEVQAIGAAACYQAIKAVATARSYLLPEGIDLSCVPLFTDVTIGEHERTAIRFIVTRHMVEPPQQ